MRTQREKCGDDADAAHESDESERPSVMISTPSKMPSVIISKVTRVDDPVAHLEITDDGEEGAGVGVTAAKNAQKAAAPRGKGGKSAGKASSPDAKSCQHGQVAGGGRNRRASSRGGAVEKLMDDAVPQPAKATPKAVTKITKIGIPKLGTQSKMQQICEQGESQCSPDECLPQQAAAGAEASGTMAPKSPKAVKGNGKEKAKAPAQSAGSVRQKRARSKPSPNKKEEENDAEDENEEEENKEEASASLKLKDSTKSAGKAAPRTCVGVGKAAAAARKTRGGAGGAGGSVSVCAACLRPTRGKKAERCDCAECEECNAKWPENMDVTECSTCMGCIVTPRAAPATKRAKKLLGAVHLGCCACVGCSLCGKRYPTKLSRYVRSSAKLWQANEGLSGGCQACCPGDFMDMLDHPESGSDFSGEELGHRGLGGWGGVHEG